MVFGKFFEDIIIDFFLVDGRSVWEEKGVLFLVFVVVRRFWELVFLFFRVVVV